MFFKFFLYLCSFLAQNMKFTFVTKKCYRIVEKLQSFQLLLSIKYYARQSIIEMLFLLQILHQKKSYKNITFLKLITIFLIIRINFMSSEI